MFSICIIKWLGTDFARKFVSLIFHSHFDLISLGRPLPIKPTSTVEINKIFCGFFIWLLAEWVLSLLYLNTLGFKSWVLIPFTPPLEILGLLSINMSNPILYILSHHQPFIIRDPYWSPLQFPFFFLSSKLSCL
jgi:hypothetical protein